MMSNRNVKSRSLTSVFQQIESRKAHKTLCSAERVGPLPTVVLVYSIPRPRLLISIYTLLIKSLFDIYPSTVSTTNVFLNLAVKVTHCKKHKMPNYGCIYACRWYNIEISKCIENTLDAFSLTEIFMHPVSLFKTCPVDSAKYSRPLDGRSANTALAF